MFDIMHLVRIHASPARSMEQSRRPRGFATGGHGTPRSSRRSAEPASFASTNITSSAPSPIVSSSSTATSWATASRVANSEATTSSAWTPTASPVTTPSASPPSATPSPSRNAPH